MNIKLKQCIAAVLAVSAVSVFAAEDTDALRSEIDALSKRLEELEKKPAPEKKADWTDHIKIKGDIRYRFQHVEAENKNGDDLSTTKNIQRIRVRLGAYADVNDFTTAGIGIRTGSKANSGNETLGSNFDGFDVSVSLAYFAIAPADAKYGTATFGKMKQVWHNATDLIWDSDVNPEGIAYDYNGQFGNSGLFGSVGYYRVQETSGTSDLNLGSAQFGYEQGMGKTKLTVGGSLYAYDNSTEFNDPQYTGNYLVDYRIAEVFAELGIKAIEALPIKLYGNVVNNTAISEQNEGYCIGIKFGDAKKGKWEAKYDWRDLEYFAAPGYFTDSDFADGGTGVRGHRIKAAYNIAKNLDFGLTYIYSQRTPDRTGTVYNQQFNTLMLDLMAKF